MLKFLLKPKDVLCQVPSDLGEVNSFHSFYSFYSFSDAGQKAPQCLSKVQNILPGIGLR